MDSGFIAKCRFRTRNNKATDMTASITLASNWFGNLFDEAILRLGGNCVEHVRNLGVVIDTFFHMQIMSLGIRMDNSVGLSLMQVMKSLILL